MRKFFLLLVLIASCGPNVSFSSRSLASEPVSSTYGEASNWSLTEGVAVPLTMTPTNAHVTFTADDAAIVRVQETSVHGTFIVIPTSPGTTKLHANGDASRVFSVTVKAQP